MVEIFCGIVTTWDAAILSVSEVMQLNNEEVRSGGCGISVGMATVICFH